MASSSTPLPTAEDFGAKYTQGNSVYHALITGYFRAVQDLVRKIPPDEIQTVLEIGCGEGYSTKRLRRLLPASVRLSASEYLQRQVVVAQQMLPEIRIVQEDVHSMHRPGNSIDVLVLLEVLEHLPEYPRALKEVFRVAKRYVIIGVPHEPWWRILNMMRGKYWSGLGNTPGHINHWTPRSMRRLLEQQGFSVLAMKLPLPWMVFLAKKRG